MADLSAEFAIGIGSTSKVVDRREARGWVERRPNPADRRSSLLALTDDGRCLQAFAQLRSALERDQIGTPTG